MSPIWSKVLESIVSEITLQETKNNWKSNQHGGIKGSPTNHIIIEAWDGILRALDKSSKNKVVVFYDFGLFKIIFPMLPPGNIKSL